MGTSLSNFELSRAAELADLTPHMVDYLCRTRVLIPSGSSRRGRGRKRLYSFGDVVVLRAMAKLLTHGISVSRLKAGLAGLRKHHPEITRKSLPSSLLLTDGRDVYFREGKDVVRDLNSGQFAFAFILDFRVIQREVIARARNYGT